MSRIPGWWLVGVLVLGSLFCSAQESPYFVTYDHHLAEPGNLDIGISSTIGVPRAGQRAFIAPYAELEYGIKTWWTSELYLEGQSTRGDSTIFTGWRWENRFRPLAKEHRINPVLYLEYENINEASRIWKEIVGFAPLATQPNSELRQSHAHELEGKLILSSDVHGWNIAENFIVEHNLLQNEGFEFGYALGVSRHLGNAGSQVKCGFCRKNFSAGLEFYGGLGSNRDFGFHETAHYAAPAVSWQLSDHSSIHLSPAVGLTHNSNPVLLRFGYSYEIEGFGRKVAAFFHGKSLGN